MTVWGDMDYEVRTLPLDGETADRLLAGRVAPEDAPPGYGPVVRLLDAASTEPTAAELEHEREQVVAFALALGASRPNDSVSRMRFSIPSTLTRARLVAVALAAALAATAGLASAGPLPDAAQNVAFLILDKLGVFVPAANDRAGTRPDEPGRSGTSPSAPSTAGERGDALALTRRTRATGVRKSAISPTTRTRRAQADQHGAGETPPDRRGRSETTPNAAEGDAAETTEVGKPTEASGVEKGAVVSTAAGKSKSQAGEHGSGGAGSDVRGKSASAPKAAPGQGHRNGSEQRKESGGRHGSPPAPGEASTPAAGPDGNGAGTLGTPGAGPSPHDPTTPSAASEPRSSPGSSNAPSGQSRRP
jgi:hypothetical protein